MIYFDIEMLTHLEGIREEIGAGSDCEGQDGRGDVSEQENQHCD